MRGIVQFTAAAALTLGTFALTGCSDSNPPPPPGGGVNDSRGLSEPNQNNLSTTPNTAGPNSVPQSH
ncbi:MAG TPA: hypothetical protein VFE47_23185 [Tepidisphaeraceae bacterium]|nr:hypothetical protein [Tepidisphaeraceae bacterium]